MEEELDLIEKNETWEMVTPLPGCKPIGLKWVYKIKRNSHGDIVRYKDKEKLSWWPKNMFKSLALTTNKFLLQWREWRLFEYS